MRKARRYFAEMKQDIINALNPTAQQEFDDTLRNLLPLCADRERFREAVLTAEGIELFAKKVAKIGSSVSTISTNDAPHTNTPPNKPTGTRPAPTPLKATDCSGQPYSDANPSAHSEDNSE